MGGGLGLKKGKRDSASSSKGHGVATPKGHDQSRPREKKFGRGSKRTSQSVFLLSFLEKQNPLSARGKFLREALGGVSLSGVTPLLF